MQCAAALLPRLLSTASSRSYLKRVHTHLLSSKLLSKGQCTMDIAMNRHTKIC